MDVSRARQRRTFLAAALAAPALGWTAPSTSEIPVGGLLREAALDGLNGPGRRLSSFRGRPLFINLWASWCGPCVDEMASIERLAWMDARPPFSIIGVSTDDYRENALAVLRRSNATISHYLDHDLLMENMLGGSKIPLSVFVDASGRILDKVTGARQWDSAQSLELLREVFGDAGQATMNRAVSR